MSIYEIIILAIALSLDALIVSFSYGLIVNKKRIKNALVLASAFGLFQFLMPVLGWNFTGFIYSYLEKYSRWVVFFIFLVLGIKFLQEALSKEDKQSVSCVTFICTLTLAVATSIDAFGAGVSIRLLNEQIIAPSLIIGTITFVLSFSGFFVACALSKIPHKYVEICGALLLFYLAIKSLI